MTPMTDEGGRTPAAEKTRMTTPAGRRLRRLGRVLLVAGLIWHLVALGSLAGGYLDPLFHDSSRTNHGKGLDFFSIYQAGWNFRHGLSVYFGVRDSRYGPENTVVPYFSGFRYLPWYAYAYGSLLSLAPPWTSYWVWLGCVELLLGVAIAVTWRLAAADPARELLAAMWLLYSPYYLELYIGQQSMVTALLTMLAGVAMVRGRWRRADLAYGASAVWKLNTLVAVPLWLRLGRFRALAGIAAFALATTVPYFALVPGAWSEFAGYFRQGLMPDGPSAHGLPALLAVAGRRAGLGLAGLERLLAWNTRMLVAAGLAATFANRRTDPVRLLAMWLASYFLIYRYTWEHHYVMLIPAFVLLFYRDRRLWLLAPFALAALPTAHAWLAEPGQPFPHLAWSGPVEIAYHAAKPLAAGAVFAAVAGGEIARAVRERDLLVSALFRRRPPAAA